MLSWSYYVGADWDVGVKAPEFQKSVIRVFGDPWTQYRNSKNKSYTFQPTSSFPQWAAVAAKPKMGHQDDGKLLVD